MHFLSDVCDNSGLVTGFKLEYEYVEYVEWAGIPPSSVYTS